MKVRLPNFGWTDVGTRLLPLKMLSPDYYTWMTFNGGGGPPLRVFGPDGWKLVSTASIQAEIFTEYTAGDIFASNRFISPVGRVAQRVNNFDWRRPPFEDTVSGFPVGETVTDGAAIGLTAESVSSTGWISDEFNTYRRYTDERLGWYSLPIGMFIDAAERRRILLNINNPGGTWASTAQLYSVDVVHRLTGFSVQKSQVPWMNHYLFTDTTTSLGAGMGVLRFEGSTPDTNNQVVVWNNGVYTVPAVESKTFTREDTDEILWSGNLNTIGTVPSGRTPFHVSTFRPAVEVTQTFDPTYFGVRDGLQYHIEVSKADDPIPFQDAYYTMHHYFDVNWFVRVNYLYMT